MQLRNRLVKADFWTDTDLVKELSTTGRMLYQGLWQLAEDSGCLEADITAYKMILFPMDDVRLEDIEEWVIALIKLEKLVPYEVNGKKCFFITNFHKHQSLRNPGKPEIPLPEWIEYIANDQPYKSGGYIIDYGLLPIDKGNAKQTVGNVNVSVANSQGKATQTNKNLNKNKKENKKSNKVSPFELIKKENGRYDYPDEFEEVYDKYPRKKGKKAAWRKWRATRKRGVDNEELLLATENYAKECKKQKTDTEYIKLAKTFFGPDEHWRDYTGEKIKSKDEEKEARRQRILKKQLERVEKYG